MKTTSMKILICFLLFGTGMISGLALQMGIEEIDQQNKNREEII